MAIQFGPRITTAKKELMCRSDEATVSKLKYTGLVERLQKVSLDPSRPQVFSLSTPDCSERQFTPNQLAYHVLRFQALRLAKKLFPDNFVDVRRLHIFRGKHGLESATYSDFVPDEDGNAKRQARYRRIFYRIPDSHQQNRMVDMVDAAERLRNPSLRDICERIEDAGLTIAHPEMNYHISDAKTVFFEICKVDFKRTYDSISKYDDAMADFILIHATLIKTVSAQHSWMEGSQGFRGAPIQEVFTLLSAIYSLYQHRSRGMNLMIGTKSRGIMDTVKQGITHLRKLAQYCQPEYALPYAVDDRIFKEENLCHSAD